METGVDESIFGDKFATGSKINELTAHADIIVTKVTETLSCARSDEGFIGKQVR